MTTKKVNIKLPESHNDLTVDQWQQLVKLEAIPDVNPDFYMRRMTKIVYGIDGNDFDRIHKKDFDVMRDTVTMVMNQKPPFQNKFELDGVTYGFIPDLDDITFGEFMDLDNYSDPEDYHKLMSILFRPITHGHNKKRYSVEPYSGSHESFKGMPLGVCLGAVNFFLNTGAELVNVTRKSLTPTQQAKMEALMRTATIKKNGGGIHQYTH